MQKISVLFSLLGSMAFAGAEAESPLLKGILIVDDSSKIRQSDLDRIDGVQFEGVVQNEALAEELTPFFSNFPLTGNGAEVLCSAITSYYHEHDDLRVAVSIPEQDSANGVVQIVMTPERMGKLNIKENRYTEPEVLSKWVRISTADPINEKTLAQDVGWMNANPFRTVTVGYQPSDQFGVTDVDLLVSDKKSWKITTGVENTGTMPIGETRIFAGVDINDFIFTDHTLKLKATAADHLKEYQSYSGEYTALLPWRNTLRIFGSYLTTVPDREPYPHRQRESFKACTRYAIPQWFGKNLWIDQITYVAGFDFKGTNTNLFFESDPVPVDKRLAFIGQFAAGVNAVRKREGSKMAAGIDLIGSPGEMLPHQTADDFENLRDGASATYFYSKLDLAIEQALIQGWNVFFQGRGQFALANLIPSEQFSLGGFNTVRGYNQDVVDGDNAVCGNFELRTPEFGIAGLWFPRVGDKLNFLGFVDAGYAWFRDEVFDAPIDQALLSVGPGVRYSVGSYFAGRFDVGFPLLKVEKDDEKPHLHFSAVLSY